MRQFYVTYSSAEFLSQAVRELVAAVPWGHHANALAVVTECIADGVILHLIKQWLKAPEVERGKDGEMASLTVRVTGSLTYSELFSRTLSVRNYQVYSAADISSRMILRMVSSSSGRVLRRARNVWLISV